MGHQEVPDLLHRRGQPEHRHHPGVRGREAYDEGQPSARQVRPQQHSPGAPRSSTDRGHFRDRRQRHPSSVRRGQGHRKQEKITITNDQNRLTPEDIEKMINDAEKFADDDAKLKSRVEARNELESYAYSLKNQIGDKEKLGAKLSDEEKAKIEEVINEKIAWLESNQEAEGDEFKAQKKEMEDIVQPIIAKLYQGAGGAPPEGEGGEGGEEDYDKGVINSNSLSRDFFSFQCEETLKKTFEKCGVVPSLRLFFVHFVPSPDIADRFGKIHFFQKLRGKNIGSS